LPLFSRNLENLLQLDPVPHFLEVEDHRRQKLPGRDAVPFLLPPKDRVSRRGNSAGYHIMSKLDTECAPGVEPDTAFEPEQIVDEDHCESIEVDDEHRQRVVRYARREYKEGTVLTRVRVLDNEFALEDGEEGDWFLEVSLTWKGKSDEPEEWSIRWAHWMRYLAGELKEYIIEWCPGGERVFETLVAIGIPDFIKDEWDRVSKVSAVC